MDQLLVSSQNNLINHGAKKNENNNLKAAN